MSLKTLIDADIKTAMKAQDKDTLMALRSIKSKILLAETAEGAGNGLTEAQEMQLLTKEAKQRKDSIAIFEKEGRADLADKEKLELAVIEKYLPQQLSDEEVKATIVAIIAETGATSVKEMGKVMGAASQKLAGKADNKKISELVKSLLS